MIRVGRVLVVLLAVSLLGLCVARPSVAASESALSGSAFVYWTNTQSGTIGRDTVDGNPLNVEQSFIGVGSDAFAAEGVAVDRQHVYFTDDQGIGRANLDGSGVNQTFIPDPGAALNQLAVDGQHIYWISSGNGAIGRANLDGTDVNYSFITASVDPGVDLEGLAVDGQYIYWSDADAGTIGRANLDGSGVNPHFLKVPVSNPSTDFARGLAVDYQHIYWADPGAGTIGRANLDGSNPNDSFITGLLGPPDVAVPVDVAVDYQHIYWADPGVEQSIPIPPGGGTIGRANLDGSDVNDNFITSDNGGIGTTGCDSEPTQPVRCGPSAVAVSVPTGPDCLRTAAPPLPPTGGAVFARPLDPNSSDANVVVLPAGSTWSGEGSCSGVGQGAAAVMTHPASISVAPGGAVLLRDSDAGLVSAWGAQDVGAGDPAPVLFPGRPDWTTTEADVVNPQTLLNSYNGCRACVLPNNLRFTPGPPSANVAYQADVSGATMTAGILTGGFHGWNFSGAHLAGASLSGADVSGARFLGADLHDAVLNGTVVAGTIFDRADLRGAQLIALKYTAPPPSLLNVRVGPFNGSCTTFQDTNLLNARLAPVKPDLLVPGCEKSPLLPRSTVPLELIYLLAHTYQANVDFADARFVVTAGNRARLAGVDLSGIDLAGARFVGFPPDFEETNFNGASLQKTNFELADLDGATFQDAHAAGASFQDASLAADANGKAASFAGATTNLQNADFFEADVSGASFQSADITGAVFDGALAVGTDFNSVIGTNARFDGAHIYGAGEAFQGARDLTGVDFVGAVLAGSLDQTGGFDLTGADLTNAKFDQAQCIACNFTGSTLTNATFAGTYLLGAGLSGVLSLQNADLSNAWLYCGDLSNDSCPRDPSSGWDWPLALGSQESYGPVPFPSTTLIEGSLTDVTACPDGTPPDASAGCASHLLPTGALMKPAPCSPAALDACPTTTSAVFDATSLGSPLAVVPAIPPTWATTVTTRGYYVGLTDGTVGLVGSGAPGQVVAGTHNARCPGPTQPCGDGGPATGALLGTPNGLAVGLDGSLYIADPTLHRVRRVDPSGTITTVAGNGQACSGPSAACGDGGPATAAALSGPYGVWAGPSGELFIADGQRGIREVPPNGTITTIGPTPGTYDVVSVAGDPTGNLYAATNNPDYLIRIDLTQGQATIVVGTGTSGYNGDTDQYGNLAPGTQVQINQPQSLSVGLDGRVVFADSGNDLIRAYVPSSGHVIDDLGGVVLPSGTTQGGFNGDGHWADQTLLDHPRGVTATRGVLYVVADTNNHEIRLIGPGPPPNKSAPRPRRRVRFPPAIRRIHQPERPRPFAPPPLRHARRSSAA